MNECPCCSHTLLKHWKNNQIYWYCSACRQEMPNLELTNSSDRPEQTNSRQKNTALTVSLKARSPQLSSVKVVKAS